MGEKQSGKKIGIGLLAFAVVLLVLFGCWKVFSSQEKNEKGEKEYTLVVKDDNGKEKKYHSNTDAEYLREALEELEKAEDFTLEGSESDYGLYIEKVNGVEASFDKDGAYWAVYVNGEYGQYGIDQQPVADGDEFKLVYEKNTEK
ncbi:MAG: DUF4430 domain-containing protein [Lachnospiraceae bacterium]|nr:DUF4430 domain-containing protein [Lachnospiraceae bacterium]